MITPSYHPVFDSHPWRNLLYMILILIGGMMVANLLAIALASVVLDGNVEILQQVLLAPDEFPKARTLLLGMQGLISLVCFIVGPLLMLKLRYQSDVYALMPLQGQQRFWITGLALFLVSIPALEYLVQWNGALELPESLDWLQSWARAKEDELAVLTRYLTTYDTPLQFLLGLVAIAVIPAIGEELTFRGLLQPMISGAVRNVHVGIWLTALLFSAFHMQFFGFLPRMMLGVVFGYIYAYSGNLLIPVAVHFINNGLGVTYSYITGKTPDDPDSFLTGPHSVAMLVSVVCMCMLVVYMHRLATSHTKGDLN